MISNIHWTSDNFDADDIYLDDFDSGVTQFGDNRYMYHAYYTLKNVSTSFEDSKLITYFYNGNEVVKSNEVYYFSNNTTVKITYDDLKDYNNAYISAVLRSDNLTNITHVVIVMVKDGKVVFNTTSPFNMSNYKIRDYSTSNHNDNSNKSDTTSSSTSNSQHTYVASSKSNKFHEPSCSQAGRIKDSNKITFSSRDEAINSGYSPCGICHP